MNQKTLDLFAINGLFSFSSSKIDRCYQSKRRIGMPNDDEWIIFRQQKKHSYWNQLAANFFYNSIIPSLMSTLVDNLYRRSAFELAKNPICSMWICARLFCSFVVPRDDCVNGFGKKRLTCNVLRMIRQRWFQCVKVLSPFFCCFRHDFFRSTVVWLISEPV